MKKLDIGTRSPKIKLRNAISKSLTVLTLATTCQISLAQVTGIVLPNQGQIHGINSPTRIPDNYIVVFKDSAVNERANQMANMRPAEARAAAVQEIGVDIATKAKGQMKRQYSAAINGMVLNTKAQKSVMALLKDPRVDYIEADQTIKLSGSQSGATWGLDRIDQANLPLNNTYNYDADGTGVNAYVIDTGIRITHNEFGNRGQSGYTAINDGNGTNDCQGHGTHVAGTIASTTYGVAKNAKLIAVRVLGCDGSGSNSGVIGGVDWVAANHVKPAVANMSLGGGASSALDSAVSSAVSQGVTMVVAAGNDNSNACNYSPARAASAITVGSTTSSDARSSFSNYGSCLDIYAPGSSITSTWSTSNTATNTISGTSMASPHVAGVAALYLDDNPNATPAQVEAAIENAAIANKVSDAKTGSPNLLLNNFYGGSGNPDPDPDPDPTPGELTNGVAVTGLSGASSSQTFFTLEVPAGATGLSFVLSGGSGDADMYVKFGSAPTTSSYDCRPYKSGNNETCSISNVQAGTYHVMLNGYSAYSGTSLTGSFTAPTDPDPDPTPGDGELTNGVAKTGLSGASGSQTFFTLDVPAGATDLSFVMSGGSGDADMYVKFGSAPTTSSYDCRPYKSGNNETCDISNVQAGTYHVMLRGYSSYSGTTLTGSFTANGGGNPGNNYFENTNNVTIGSGGANTVNSYINVNRSGASGSIRVQADIKHTWVGDLEVKIYAPNGASGTLHARTNSGDSSDDLLLDVTLDAGTAESSGQWRLEVADMANGDGGYIDSWSIEFQ
ncbi:MAG: S8 family serine peptidase [Xanthomonadales bacterium]|nr:S8 family serine peptidase [Xanthomonadales bacterium]